MPAQNSLYMLCACRDRSEVLESFIFQGYNNRALQGLYMGTPQGAPQGRYGVYYKSLFQKGFSKDISNYFALVSFLLSGRHCGTKLHPTLLWGDCQGMLEVDWTVAK